VTGFVATSGQSASVQISAGDVVLDGDLTLPSDASAIVVFAHGSGSSRHSPRNRHVADALNAAGFATLLIDLLTAAEDEIDARTRELRFDIALLAARLTAAVDWSGTAPATAQLPVLLYGASTGAAAALVTAAARPGAVRGVVSRGGRPDLASEAFARLAAPVFLIVGGNDPIVQRLNDEAARAIAACGEQVEVAVIPGATHLFEEPGALDAVVQLTIQRLQRWVAGTTRQDGGEPSAR
jgi:putative phosphoribosyl transferase